MKPFLYLAILSSILSFSCLKLRNVNNSEMKEFKCLFIGENEDINHFLGLEKENKNDDIRMQIFANQYIFLHGDKSLMIYGFDDKTNIFETFKLKEISTQLKTDRKYKMQVFDSTNRGFKLKIESGDKTFTQLKSRYIIVECLSN